METLTLPITTAAQKDVCIDIVGLNAAMDRLEFTLALPGRTVTIGSVRLCGPPFEYTATILRTEWTGPSRGDEARKKSADERISLAVEPWCSARLVRGTNPMLLNNFTWLHAAEGVPVSKLWPRGGRLVAVNMAWLVSLHIDLSCVKGAQQMKVNMALHQCVVQLLQHFIPVLCTETQLVRGKGPMQSLSVRRLSLPGSKRLPSWGKRKVIKA